MSASSWVDALVEPSGQRLLDELSAESITPDNEISLITRFRRSYPAELVATALEQTMLRRRARRKFSNAERMYFTQAALEQASTERTSRHRAKRYQSFERVVDLCCGIGGDAIALAVASHVAAVDKDRVHARLVQLNAAANGVGGRVHVVNADVRDIRLADGDAIFIDPARRASGKRFVPGQSEPSLDWCLALAQSGAGVGLKAAPGLPVELVPSGWEVEFVSEDGELKEAMLWSPSFATATRRATLLPSGETLVRTATTAVDVREPGRYLLDPDPSITRAGLVEDLATLLGDCWKIDDRIAFLSSNALLRTPFARTLAVEASMPWSLARLRESLRSLDVGVVDIRKRGSAVDVDELQRKLNLRGSRLATVVLTRVANRPWVFVCVDPS